jgi:hypothetical protein
MVLGTALLGLTGLAAGAQDAGSRYEAVVKDVLAATEKMTAVLVAVKDAASASEARPALKKAVADFVAVRKRAEALEQPSQEERDRIDKAYRKKLAEAVTNLRTEISRVGRVAGGREALQELSPLEDLRPARPSGEKKK